MHSTFERPTGIHDLLQYAPCPLTSQSIGIEPSADPLSTNYSQHYLGTQNTVTLRSEADIIVPDTSCSCPQRPRGLNFLIIELRSIYTFIIYYIYHFGDGCQSAAPITAILFFPSTSDTHESHPRRLERTSRDN